MRQKRRPMFLLAGILGLCAVLFCGCGSVRLPEEVVESALAVSKTGEVTAWLVEEFAQDYYELSELQAMALEEIADYNETHRSQGYEAAVEAVEQSEDGSRVTVRLHFNGTDAYEAYTYEKTKTEVTLFYGTVQEAQLEGLMPDGGLAAVKDGASLTGEELLQMAGRHVLITNAKLLLYGPMRPQYLSAGLAAAEDGSVDASQAEGMTCILSK